MGDYVIGAVTGAISKGIAITSETIAGRKNKDKNYYSTATVRKVDSPAIEDSVDFVEREWQLDEAFENDPPSYEETEVKRSTVNTEDNSERFVNNFQNAIGESTEYRPIPQPVILPQRRPKDRTRGFVRAYAPVLGEYSGITQDMFLDFLNNWATAADNARIFDVINMACMGISFIPHPAAIAVGTTVGFANETARQMQRLYRSNRYLERMNETLFKPRGLFAMIMAYCPEQPDEAILEANMANPHSVSAIKNLNAEQSRLKSKLRRFRMSSGKVHSDAQIPDPAPLIYPHLDRMLLEGDSSSPHRLLAQSSQSTSAVTTTGPSQEIITGSDQGTSRPFGPRVNNAVMNDYLDRRAAAQFSATHPNSKLAALQPEQKEFVNRYCDPNHPVNNGSIFALLTGGTFDPIGQGRIQRAKAAAKRKGEPPLTESEKHDALMGRKVRGRTTGTPSKNNPLSRFLKKDVLYLVIVNMPTEKEIQEVRDLVSSD